jgi:hypothetical protein
MTNERQPKKNPDQALVYQIRIEGHLGQQWEDWFGSVSITREENGQTLITCTVPDQAALFGLLKKARDLGLPLVSVTRLASGQEDDEP